MNKKPKTRNQKPSSSPPTVGMISLGCPKNLVDSEVLLGYLNQAGFAFTGDVEAADIIVVNTCSFIEPAVEEAKQTLQEAAELKRVGRCRVLICAGCLSHREGATLPAEFPEVDAFLGVNDIPQISGIVSRLLESGTGISARAMHDQDGRATHGLEAHATYLYDHTAPRVRATPPWTAYVKIAEGCHHRCSFCTIPTIRGAYRSRQPESVLAEVQELAEQGVEEVVFIGQDTTAYGRDVNADLPDLLTTVDAVDGIRWVRLMYAFPGAVSERLLESMASSQKVCHYLDIPLQHAHPRILRLMHRPGSGEEYLKQIAQIRTAMPDVALRSAFIVGFPGETDAEFQALLDFLTEAKLDRVGAFIYCRETGTPAAEMAEQVPPEVAEERYHQLMSTQQEISFQRNQEWIGKEIEVLVEREENGQFIGRSYRDAPEIDGEVILDKLPRKHHPKFGQFITVKVIDASEYDLFGSTKIV